MRKRLCNGRVSVRTSVCLSRRSIASKQQRRAAGFCSSARARAACRYRLIAVGARAATAASVNAATRGTRFDIDLIQGRSRRSGHGLTTFSATNFFYYTLPFKVIAHPPYDSTSALHGRTTFQKLTTTL